MIAATAPAPAERTWRANLHHSHAQRATYFVGLPPNRKVKQVFDRALAGVSTSAFEFPLYSKSGKRIEVLLNANPRRDAGGKITGVVGVGQDITARIA